MTDRDEGPRPGSRDNGLRASNYVAVADLDPRVAEALLETLRGEGIAAYVSPTQGPRVQHTDRLYVDETRARAAADLVAAEDGPQQPRETEPQDLDVDTAWQQVLASLQSAAPTSRPWPASEDVSPEPEASSILDLDDEPEDEHFEPPEPPPLPTFRPVTIGSLLAIIAGIFVVVTGVDGGDLWWLGTAAIIGGAISLVWHVKDGPPNDSGWDDGAVV